MTGQYLYISDNDGKTTRELKDNAATQAYITKLSHAHAVRVYYSTGEWYTVECGWATTPRGMNDDGRRRPQ